MNLTPEQTAIVTDRLEVFNSANPSSQHTLESFVTEVGMQTVRDWQSQAITQKGLQMVSTAQQYLTEENRIKFTNEVEQILTSYITAQ